MRVLLIGAAGRMGQTVLNLAQGDREIDIAAQCDLGDSIEPAMKNCDVAIDFSQADSIDEICRAASQQGKSLVIGTTGHSQQQRKTIETTADSVPIVLASNFCAEDTARYKPIRAIASIRSLPASCAGELGSLLPSRTTANELQMISRHASRALSSQEPG